MYDVIESLKQVPEVRLRIIGLAWEVLGEDGAPDVKKMSFHIKELEEAVAEAQGYSSDTREAVRCLKAMDPSEY